MAGGGSFVGHHDHQYDCGHDHRSGQIPRVAQQYGPVEPVGEIVSVYTEANPNYRLTVRDDGAVLAFKNSRDVYQQWIKVDVGPGKGDFIDREEQPGFILVNRTTGFPLKHGHQVNDFVTARKQLYNANTLEGSIIWSLGRKDEGNGYKGLRPVTNITLNVDAEHADKGHGGVRDGNRLLLSHWKPMENFKWKIETLEPME